ncbi:MAG: tRNA-dihydrouridine synthase C [Syntrophaceae bacterium PtaB.Bin038]|nr:MAG: tRNA-dihydrouridine synthase C [Syntrophaceae bacterium PtaB.Bin038]
MNIATLELSNNLILAPLAGISDLPFRTIARRFGCGLCYSEMVSADGIVRGQRKTLDILRSGPGDRPLIAQIFGSDPGVLAAAAEIIEERGLADAVDINMGCPVKPVIRRGAGAALMREPERVRLIIREARRSVRIPLTVKIRSGWSPTEKNALEIARIAEGEGADAVAVHPRTASQGFSGRSDWSVIAEVKAALKIPVIGNGDVETPGDASALLGQTGCDGIMIGRAALGNPWIFRNALRHLAGEGIELANLEEKRRVIGEHLEMSVGRYGEVTGVKNFRKHLFWYTKGLRGSAAFRKGAGTVTGKGNVLAVISAYFETLAEVAAEEKMPLDFLGKLNISFNQSKAFSRLGPGGTEER